MKPIPKAAMPIVDYIRKNVPRPDDLPEMHRGALRWLIGDERFCIMGLCPCTRSPQPFTIEQFDPTPLGFTQNAITDTLCWWDDIYESDAQAVCDAIWRKRCKKQVMRLCRKLKTVWHEVSSCDGGILTAKCGRVYYVNFVERSYDVAATCRKCNPSPRLHDVG